jgi:outer membrane protein assembly factor BamB
MTSETPAGQEAAGKEETMTTTKALTAMVCFLTLVGGLACKRNHPPDVPAILTGPTYCFRDTTYTFKTVVNDPDGDSVSVRVRWTNSSVSGWSGWVASGETVLLTHYWPDAGDYQVSVQARDQKLITSDWSDTLDVQVVTRYPPSMPHEIIGPSRGGQDSSYTFSTSASHPDGITVGIRFAWGDGDTSDWSWFVPSGETVTMTHVWTAPDTYAVTAQARDTGGGRSLWTLPHTIVIRPPDTLRKWRFQLDAGESPYMHSSPAIGPDGVLYVGSSDSSLYAVNAEGTLKWRYLTGSEVQSSPAIGSDGTVYFGSSDDYLRALDQDGNLRWSYRTSGYVRASPAIAADGAIYFGSSDGYLYALNPDGTLRWRYETSGTVSSPCIAADGTIYVGSYNDSLYAVNPDGTRKWGYDVGDNVNRASPALGADGTVYCGADRNRSGQSFYAFSPDGTLKWSYATGGDIRSSPAIASDGTIYFGSGDYSLYALNPDSTLKWSFRVGSRILYSSPAVSADGTVYFGSYDNCLYAVSPDGTLKWRYETDGDVRSSPTIGTDGTVYFTSDDGYLYALKGTSPLAGSPWPKFHHDLRNTGRAGGGR